jgi:hypothetical protein
MVDGTAVKEIAALERRATEAETGIIEVGDRRFSVAALREIGRESVPEPDVLMVSTLTAFTDYVTSNRDDLDLGECLVHVHGPARVDLVTTLTGPRLQRWAYISARARDRFASMPEFRLNQFLPVETVVLALQALFADTATRNELAQLLGNVVSDAGVQQEDDGVTQRVTAKSGVRLVQQERVRNPWKLAPWCSFPDIDQPVRPFVLRLKAQEKGPVHAGLWEADGGAWQDEISHRIAADLAERMPDLTVIA